MRPGESVRFGGFEVDVTTGELLKHGTRLKLQEQPAKILAALLKNPGEVVNREDLIKLLWADGTFVDYDRGLNAAVTRLRQALSDSAESPRYVETVARRGYRFVAPVEKSGRLDSPPAAVPRAQPASLPARPKWFWFAGVAVLLALAVGSWLWRSRPDTSPLTPIPLTSYDGVETEPSFSPDASQVAFAWNGTEQNNYDIYVKVVGSDAPHRLTTNPAPDRSPAWSPDGRSIAFIRDKHGIFVVSPLGGVERRIVADVANSLSWSADSKYLVFGRFASETETGGVFLIQAQGGGAQRLIAPGLPDSARTVALSPDGRSLAVNFHLIELNDLLKPRGPAKLLASRSAVVDRIAWTADSSAVIFSEFVPGLGLGQGADQQLVRIGIRGKTGPEPLSFAGQGATMATISRSGSRVAYSKTQANTDIWKLEDGVFTRSPLSSTLHDGSPQFSPDGSRVAFNSNRSGHEEIWVANADGSGVIRLTSSIASGTPRWSPDGRRIVYDTRSADGNWHIHVMDAAGGPSSPLADGFAPSFSRDNNWVYYTGGGGISRVPSAGGDPILVAETRGGRAVLESADESSIYYTVSSGCGPLVRRPKQGGPEKIVADTVCFRAFAVTRQGIYYVSGSAQDPEFTVRFLDPRTGESTVLGESKGRYLGQGLTVSPDGKTILLSASTQTGADLYLVDNFR